MGINERLMEEQNAAIKSKDTNKLSTIRMLRAAIKNEEIANRGPLSDDQAQAVLNRQVKQRRESIEEFSKANRQDLVDKEKAELEVLITYLPPQMSEHDLEIIVREVITRVGATSQRDLGKVMPAVMAQVKGRAEGSKVNQIAQKILSQSQAV